MYTPSSHAASAPLRSPLQIQWMAVSFGLFGIIAGFSLHSFAVTNVQAHVSAPTNTQLPIIRPPDPSALAQGGGCGGGSTKGGGCGGGAQGGGCGGGGCGGNGSGGGGCGSAQPSRT